MDLGNEIDRNCMCLGRMRSGRGGSGLEEREEKAVERGGYNF